jgi:hypothetical protein
MPTRAQRPRLPETSEGQLKARYAWNEGLTGKPRPPVQTAVVKACTVGSCGTSTSGPRPAAGGMVQVRGAADGAAAHWYCVERCAAIARASADLRAITMRQDGEGR